MPNPNIPPELLAIMQQQQGGQQPPAPPMPQQQMGMGGGNMPPELMGMGGQMPMAQQSPADETGIGTTGRMDVTEKPKDFTEALKQITNLLKGKGSKVSDKGKAGMEITTISLSPKMSEEDIDSAIAQLQELKARKSGSGKETQTTGDRTTNTGTPNFGGTY